MVPNRVKDMRVFDEGRWSSYVFVLTIAIVLVLILSACTPQAGSGSGSNKSMAADSYKEISPEEAKEIMGSGESYVVLDVRTQSEYDEGHIPKAVLLPVDDVAQKASAVLPNKSQTILVYCRSGRRSKIAAEQLVSMGYTNVKEFGGINDWPYDVEG